MFLQSVSLLLGGIELGLSNGHCLGDCSASIVSIDISVVRLSSYSPDKFNKRIIRSRLFGERFSARVDGVVRQG